MANYLTGLKKLIGNSLYRRRDDTQSYGADATLGTDYSEEIPGPGEKRSDASLISIESVRIGTLEDKIPKPLEPDVNGEKTRDSEKRRVEESFSESTMINPTLEEWLVPYFGLRRYIERMGFLKTAFSENKRFVRETGYYKAGLAVAHIGECTGVLLPVGYGLIHMLV